MLPTALIVPITPKPVSAELGLSGTIKILGDEVSRSLNKYHALALSLCTTVVFELVPPPNEITELIDPELVGEVGST